MRWQVFADFRAAQYVFSAVEAKIQRHMSLGFCTDNTFVSCFPSSVVDTCVARKGEFRSQGRPVLSSVVQEVPTITGGLLILGFDFTVSPGECAVRGREVVPSSFVQFMKSALMKAIPRSCTID